MFDPDQQPRRTLINAEEGKHLPLWQLAEFSNGSVQSTIRRRPQSPEEKRAIEMALLAAQREAERRAREETAAALKAAEAAAAAAGAAARAAEPQAPPAPPPPAVAPEEVERIKAAAFDEGYAAGYDHGSAAARREAERLAALAQDAAGIFARFEAELAPRLLDMATEIARQVIQRELALDNNAVLPVVRDAFDQLTGGETGRQLLLNPADVQLVRAHLGEELDLGQWKIVEDAGIEPGGCRIATQQSDIDATLPTRWKRTLAALGRDTPWNEGHG